MLLDVDTTGDWEVGEGQSGPTEVAEMLQRLGKDLVSGSLKSDRRPLVRVQGKGGGCCCYPFSAGEAEGGHGEEAHRPLGMQQAQAAREVPWDVAEATCFRT
jgi:hypothetical protein